MDLNYGHFAGPAFDQRCPEWYEAAHAWIFECEYWPAPRHTIRDDSVGDWAKVGQDNRSIGVQHPVPGAAIALQDFFVDGEDIHIFPKARWIVWRGPLGAITEGYAKALEGFGD